ncbi:RING-H2 finger protein ATL79 [Linum perenne]
MRYWPTSDSHSPPPDGSIPITHAAAISPSAATILIVLLCIVICVVALNTAIRCFLGSGGGGAAAAPERNKGSAVASVAVAEVASTVVYRGGGCSSCCAICLAEFETGEEIEVLGNCGHGFHNQCIQRWFCISSSSSGCSCPTCRRSCLPPPPSPES